MFPFNVCKALGDEPLALAEAKIGQVFAKQLLSWSEEKDHIRENATTKRQSASESRIHRDPGLNRALKKITCRA